MSGTDSWTAHCNWHRARQIDIKQVVIRYLIDARLVNLQLHRVNASGDAWSWWATETGTGMLVCESPRAAIQLKLPKGPPWLSNWGNVTDTGQQKARAPIPRCLAHTAGLSNTTTVMYRCQLTATPSFQPPKKALPPIPLPDLTFCVCEIQDGPVFIYFRRICF